MAGEELLLMHERAVYWTAARTLLVADLHLGKGAAFRSLGVPVPRGSSMSTLERLRTCIDRTGCERVVALGDLMHATRGLTEDLLREVARWRQTVGAEMLLIRGNHDKALEILADALDATVCGACEVQPPFAFVHELQQVPEAYALSGHIHPCVLLHGFGNQAMRAPCFWLKESGAVLPAFGDFTGCAQVIPSAGDRVFVCIEDSVAQVHLSQSNG